MQFGAKKQLHVPLLCLTLKVEYKSLAKMIRPCISRRVIVCLREMFCLPTKTAKLFQVPFDLREQGLIVSLGAPTSVSVAFSTPSPIC